MCIATPRMSALAHTQVISGLHNVSTPHLVSAQPIITDQPEWLTGSRTNRFCTMKRLTYQITIVAFANLPVPSVRRSRRNLIYKHFIFNAQHTLIVGARHAGSRTRLVSIGKSCWGGRGVRLGCRVIPAAVLSNCCVAMKKGPVSPSTVKMLQRSPTKHY